MVVAFFNSLMSFYFTVINDDDGEDDMEVVFAPEKIMSLLEFRIILFTLILFISKCRKKKKN